MTSNTPDRSDKSDRSVKSVRSSPDSHTPASRMLRPHGGYRQLRSFQVAEIVYDGTVAFWDRFIDKRSRTHDQMVQAARSGRQNIAEGSRASGTSSQTELRLVGVARASLDELLLDYEDFLRQKCLTIWAKDDPRALKVRAIGHSGSGLSHPSSPTDRPDPTGLSNRMASPGNPPATPYSLYRTLVEDSPPETAANTLICLIHQANYLLDRQLQELERQFIQGGGYTEQLAAARRDERDRQSGRVSHRADRTDPTDPSAAPTPACPKCGQPMVLRTARKGPRAGSQFWGCRGYPDCTGTLPKK